MTIREQASELQRDLALQRANHVRLTRARVRAELKGETRAAAAAIAADLLTNPPEWAETWQIGDLLEALPRVGQVAAASICNYAHALPTRRLRDLTPRQRQVIAERINPTDRTGDRP